MQEIEDRIWNTITESAKNRFDYAGFASQFQAFEPHVAENVLFKILLGLAEEKTPGDIVRGINVDFILLGFSLDVAESERFVEQCRQDLTVEIKATHTALALFDMGAQGPGVLVQIRSILKKGGVS